MNRSLVSLVLLSLAAHAGAQVYKTVGPDGKVSYSDRPPLEATAPEKVRIVKDGGTRTATGADLLKHGAAARPPAAPPASTSSVARTPEEWRAFAAAKRASAVAGVWEPAPLTPDQQARQFEQGKRLAPGVTVALRQASLTRAATSMCMRTQPASKLRYELALQEWEARNRPVTKRAYELLAKYFPHSDRAQLEAMAQKESHDTLNEVARTSPAQRINWCEQMRDSIAGGRADLAASAPIASMMRLSE